MMAGMFRFSSSAYRYSALKPYASGFPLFQQIVQQTVVEEALFQERHAVVRADAVQKIIVDIVCLEFLERLVVHADGGIKQLLSFHGACKMLVGHFGGNEIGIARMAAEGDSGSLFRKSPHVGRGGVEIVDAVGQCIVHQFVDRFLVYDFAFSVG